MQHTITRYLTLHGQFDAGSFPDWICHRARVLNLSGWVKPQGDSQIDILASGELILLEAFEVACSLGPVDILVDRIDQKPGNHGDVSGGFVQL